MECMGLTKTYGRKAALDKIDLKIESGRIIGLLGPNGSGKTTLIKLACGLLSPTSGEIIIDGHAPGVHTKSVVSYLPDRMYFADWMRTRDLLRFFADFYEDFDQEKAEGMLADLGVSVSDRLKTMSKGTKEKVQLVLAMSRRAKLYLLDEPIGGVDPAAREFILRTILANYSPEAALVISTHLIADIEKVLDEVIFLQNGRVVRQDPVDSIRENEGKSVDQLFREIFGMGPVGGREGREMFGKLLKYEWRAAGHALLPFYLVVLAVSAVNSLMIHLGSGGPSEELMDSALGELIQLLGFMLYFGVIVALIILTAVVIVQRFYKGIVGDEGCLVLTAPVDLWEIPLAKCVIGLVFTGLSVMAGVCSIIILMNPAELLRMDGQIRPGGGIRFRTGSCIRIMSGVWRGNRRPAAFITLTRRTRSRFS